MCLRDEVVVSTAVAGFGCYRMWLLLELHRIAILVIFPTMLLDDPYGIEQRDSKSLFAGDPTLVPFAMTLLGSLHPYGAILSRFSCSTGHLEVIGTS